MHYLFDTLPHIIFFLLEWGLVHVLILYANYITYGHEGHTKEYERGSGRRKAQKKGLLYLWSVFTLRMSENSYFAGLIFVTHFFSFPSGNFWDELTGEPLLFLLKNAGFQGLLEYSIFTHKNSLVKEKKDYYRRGFLLRKNSRA